jgi:large subunit ribosomal protein L15
MYTNNLKKIVTRRKKRLGRGLGSGKGFHTVGKGQKGQTSRGGYHAKRGFEGGAVPLAKRLPVLRGFKSRKPKALGISISNLLDINVYEIDSKAMKSISRKDNVVLVGAVAYDNYDLKKVVVKKDVKLSKSLKQKIVDNGGTVEE